MLNTHTFIAGVICWKTFETGIRN